MAALKLSTKNILGVYINCHGEFLPDFIISKSPPNLNITKKNLSGYGCPAYQISRGSKLGMPIEHEVALSLTRHMGICLSEEQYSGIKHTDKYGDKIDKTKSCEEFTAKQWVAKTYSMSKGKIVFALNGRIFDVSTGFANFLTFLTDVGGELPQNESLQIYKVLTHLESVFSKNKKNTMDTNTIFNIMYAIQLHTQITNVNMLDESCNVIIDKSQQPLEKRDSKSGEMVLLPVLVTRDKLPPLPPGTGYGGTKKHKKYKRKTQYRVKK
jgi:hypothetical protein